MKKIKFEYYTRPNGQVEFQNFLESLPVKDQIKLLSVIKNVQDNGLMVAQQMQWVKKLDDNLFDLRSKVSTNIQRGLYFHAEANHYVITHGFSKKTQKTPTREIHHAKRMRDEYEQGGKEQ